jgi:protein-S-isoprenylcysteine O-methyltransferase Ste14
VTVAPPPGWLVGALVVAFWAADLPMWRGRAARMRPSAQDRGSFRANNTIGLAALAAGLASAALLRGHPRLAIPAPLAWAGAPLVVLGGALRSWSIVTLGPRFTFYVRVEPGQPLVDGGPYRLVRHPSYAGGLLALVGLALACGTWPSFVLVVAPWVALVAYRIRVEERALEETLGDAWRAYARRTRRLVPGVW